MKSYTVAVAVFFAVLVTLVNSRYLGDDDHKGSLEDVDSVEDYDDGFVERERRDAAPQMSLDQMQNMAKGLMASNNMTIPKNMTSMFSSLPNISKFTGK